MATLTKPGVDCTDEIMSVKAYEKYIDEQDKDAAFEDAREALKG